MVRAFSSSRESSSLNEVTASKRFGRYKKEPGKEERPVEVAGDPTLRKMLEVCKTYYKTISGMGIFGAGSTGQILERIYPEGLSPSSDDIKRFVVAYSGRSDAGVDDFKLMKKGLIENEAIGILLSKFIEAGRDDEYELDLIALGMPVCYLVASESKRVIVHGDVLHEVGTRMAGGMLEIHGNADFGLGWEMSGGSIEVHGYAGMHAGHAMTGGTITIHGNCGSDLAYYMEGGVIRFRDGLPPENTPIVPRIIMPELISGGKVYCNGKLIVDR
jgi:hypothetical protein